VSEVPSVKAPSGEVRPRGNKTVGDITRSLVPLVILVVLAVWVLWPRVGSTVREVDPSGDLRDAGRLGLFTVLAPSGLPSGWRATSSKLDRPAARQVTIRIGYLTPAERYARYVQSNVDSGALLSAEIPGATRDGSVRVGGRSWDRYRADRGELAYVLPGAATLLVTGSADAGELSVLASSLR
jgi:hypothetical protein